MNRLLISALILTLFVGNAHAMENLVTREDCENAYSHMAQTVLSWHDESAKSKSGSYWCSFNGFPGTALIGPDRQKEYRVLENEYRALCNKFHEQGKEFLRAAQAGDLDKMQILLATGVDVDTHDDGTALIYAAGNGHVAICKFLIEAGASITCAPFISASYRNEVALVKAAWEGHEDICRLLLNAEKSAGEIDQQKARALHADALDRAVFRGHFAICEMLLAAGADLYRRDSVGNSILFKAYSHARNKDNRIPLCEMLIEHMLSAPTAEQSKRAATFLCCMKANNYNGEYSNIRKTCKRAIIGTFLEENKNKNHRAYKEVKDLPWDNEIKQHLLQKYFPDNAQ